MQFLINEDFISEALRSLPSLRDLVDATGMFPDFKTISQPLPHS
jgi:hypothetical protein